MKTRNTCYHTLRTYNKGVSKDNPVPGGKQSEDITILPNPNGQ